VSDKQVYGRANMTHKNYNLKTSTGLNLLNEIDPVEFRKLVNKEKYYQWSESECSLLSREYNILDEDWQEIVRSINKRLSCPEIEELLDIASDDKGLDGNKIWFSVFAILGWVMFILLFAIKLFWRFAKGHKKIEE